MLVNIVVLYNYTWFCSIKTNMTILSRLVNIFGVLVITACLLLGSADGQQRRYGPFPGFFGNQVCVKQEGFTLLNNESLFLIACRSLPQVKTCYGRYTAPSREFFYKIFNISNFIPAYTSMCNKLNVTQFKQNGMVKLRKLESNALRKKVYQQAYVESSKYASEKNYSEAFIAMACKKTVEWSNLAELYLAGDEMASIRAIMNATLWEVLTDTCRTYVVTTTSPTVLPTVFPSLFGITLSKPGKVCMDSKFPKWSYLYDQKRKCDGATDTHLGHLSCGRAEQVLQCINSYFVENSFKPDTSTYAAKFLFDLKQQKKAFSTYCVKSRDVRQQLQCVPIKVVNAFRKSCYVPWINKVTSLLGGKQKSGIKAEVCRETIKRITCEQKILSSSVRQAAEFYAKLQKDSLPHFCNNQVTGGLQVTTASAVTTSSDTNIYTYNSLVVIIAYTLTVLCKSVAA